MWYATTSWTPMADGSIALIDAASYHLKRWTNGATREVAALPFTPETVIPQDREAVIKAEKDVKPIPMGQGGATPATAPPRPEMTFPPTLPAFAPDMGPYLQKLEKAAKAARIPSPLAGEGGPRSGSDEGLRTLSD